MWKDIELLIHRSTESAPMELEELQQEYLGFKRENYYRFLYRMVEHFQPEICLEIGVGQGLGSAHMCAAAIKYGGFVVGVDEKFHDVPLQSMYGNYQFFNDKSLSAFSSVRQLVESLNSHVGFVYQDGSHHYHESVDEFRSYSTLMRPGSIWICDGITSEFHNLDVDPPDKGMIQYFDEIPTGNKRLYKDILHYESIQGIAIL